MTKPFKNHYYHSNIRRTITFFGALFNNIRIVKLKEPTDIGNHRTNKGNKPLEFERRLVPIEYGPKEKFVGLLNERENVKEKPNIPIPRMYYEMVELSPDIARNQSKNEQYSMRMIRPGDNAPETIGRLFKNFVPTPWDFNMQLGIFTRSEDDAFQILEQILPLFTPSYTLSLNMTNDTREKRDISVIYNGIIRDDQWSGDFKERRYLVYILSFTVKSYLFGPVKTTPTILNINVGTTGLTGQSFNIEGRVETTTLSIEDKYEELYIKRLMERIESMQEEFIDKEITIDFIKLIDITNSRESAENILKIDTELQRRVENKILINTERVEILKELKLI